MTGNRSVFITTLGCDKNLVDSEALLGRFMARGISLVEDPDAADILVVNTCGFIEAARLDSYDAIATLCARKGGRTLVVTGCLSQEQGAALAGRFPEVDLVSGVGNFDRILEALEARADRIPIGRPGDARYDGLADRPLLTPPHLAFVKISEGCNFRCAFCRIPTIRGNQRSRPVAEIAGEVARLAGRGVAEIMLVAQNTSDYGRGQGEDLLDLVRVLGGIAGLRRIRMHYLYPGLIDGDRFRRILETPKVVPYVDMPIQHASPRILRRMNRPFAVDELERFFTGLRAERPGVVLRTTILLGFPGEEEEDVEVTADFLSRIRFDHVGTYRYSPEAGTPGAERADTPDPEEVADREARLLDLQHDISLVRQLSRLGQIDEVVVDDIGDLTSWRDLTAELERAAVAQSRDDAEPSAAPGRLFTGGEVAVARGTAQAYDVDGVILMPAHGLSVGQWLRARTLATTPYDSLALPVGMDG
ncbi:MiaB/RimO family radical SAM methylthiotransferase [bacterium]|nr:MiaB/RimO family radical SAM methylthiotransferase [bacterium]MBU1073562.1 MiaB/RimO family radical SAM methylthiotransferase [bacterium]MBU1674513.1 MiaB/RimO family radical SAM methylthiotransferase [bacterium]